MAAGVQIKHKRKAGAFTGGQLAAGEMGLDTTNSVWYYSIDGSTVATISATDPAEVTLTDGATVSIDPSLGKHFFLSGGTGRILSMSGAGTPGQVIIVRWKNTGGSPLTHTLEVGSTNDFRYPGTATALNETAAGITEAISVMYHDIDDKWDVLGYTGAEFPDVLTIGQVIGIKNVNFWG